MQEFIITTSQDINLTNKAVIFDGDGTLWRPVGQDKNSRPDNIYIGDRIEKDSHASLALIDGVPKMLSNLHSRGYRIFIISAHPTPGAEALKELESKITALGIIKRIDKFFCSDGSNKNSKTEVIHSIINEFKLSPSQTYMIGDSYYYDYEAGVKAGVNSYFIKNDYCKQPSPLPDNVHCVNNVTDLIVK